MSTAMTLFRLVGDSSGMFDGSVTGVPILRSTGAKVLPQDSGIALEKGAIDIGRQSDLDSLQSFTIEAEITPSSLDGTRQNIIEGQTPSIALFVESNSKLVGSVHTAAGWVAVDSGAVLLRAGTSQRVTFTRDISGKNELSIDGRSVGSVTAAGPIQNVGPLGFRVGRGMDGTSFPFSGTVKDLSIRQGVVTQQFFAQQTQTAQRLEAKVRQAGLIKNIVVNLLPDASHARLQHVKDIMNAAGVQTLSDLDTLPGEDAHDAQSRPGAGRAQEEECRARKLGGHREAASCWRRGGAAQPPCGASHQPEQYDVPAQSSDRETRAAAGDAGPPGTRSSCCRAVWVAAIPSLASVRRSDSFAGAPHQQYAQGRQ